MSYTGNAEMSKFCAGQMSRRDRTVMGRARSCSGHLRSVADVDTGQCGWGRPANALVDCWRERARCAPGLTVVWGGDGQCISMGDMLKVSSSGDAVVGGCGRALGAGMTAACEGRRGVLWKWVLSRWGGQREGLWGASPLYWIK